ncbi:hypothetical protein V5F41_08220 [Xanthobacter autotrophicus]|uniref:hypothetical protein n=1 Tax=Xanthobacter autotrophicus TaxID=280 RepID=UPI0037281DCF
MAGEMQERIARAIYEGRNGAGCVPWSRRDRAHKAPYLSDAIAVMKAMREPTPTMSLAADDAVVEQYAEHPEWEEAKDMAEGLIPTRIWAAMLSHEIAAAEEAKDGRS